MSDPGAKLFDDALSPERVFVTRLDSKEAVLNFLIDALWQSGEVQDLDAFRSAVYMRESLMSTGIGLGVGVPHARLSSVRRMIMAVAVNETPLDDYESIDGHPVRIVALVAGRTDQQSNYVRLLATLSRLVKDETRRSHLLAASDAETVYTLLRTGL
ncbi:MAG: PTS sugar transporter subunit IIA [Verrucomicrobia bacterium]|nr:PTS sugar transporter subunit IIA [Verrucomicrobiota bacterium]MCH8528211.1 PTS sugar transporter subunit IIA [Kiritimatiellia bacterium]